jgi:O-antigen/teichoic acid export membrane protein
MINILKNKTKDSKLFLFSKNLVKHPLFSGSALMIIGSNSANFIAYIYHLIIGRMLGPASYGELASILSLIALISTSFSFFGLVIVKFVSAAENKDLPSILGWFTKKMVIFGGVVTFIILIITPFLSRFISVKIGIVVLLVPIFMVGIASFLYRSFLQGILRFKQVVISSNAEILGRLILGVAFIYLGFGVFGTILGLFLAAFVSFLILRYFLRDIKVVDSISRFSEGSKVLKYSVPIFISSVATTSFFTSDVILVKHFFSAHDAGIYASLSTLGKIVFYGTAPIAAVMFPMISKRHAKGQEFKKIFFISLILTSAISLGIILIYWLLPIISVNILYGSKFLEGSRYLVWFGIFMGIYSLCSLFINFYLSRERTKIVIPLVIFAAIQVIGIWIIHENILNVIRVSIFTASLLLVFLLIYFTYDTQRKKV